MANHGCDEQKLDRRQCGLGNLAFDRYPVLNKRHDIVDPA
jgi:hypothetical protein